VTGLFAAELLKLRTVRATWGYVIAALGLGALVTAGSIGGESAEAREAADFQSNLLLDAAFPTTILALLLGIILVTNEFRHGTITPTLLVTPRRELLLGTKLAAGGVTGMALVVVALVVSAVIAAIWLGALGVPLEPGDTGGSILKALVGAALAGLLGAALGGAIHSQVAALVGALVWIFVAEPLVWGLLGLLDVGGAAEYLPSAILLSLVSSEEEGLSWGTVVGMELAWIALATAAAAFRTGRRDIT
jgi:ABC-2 type transport system permease protein